MAGFWVQLLTMAGFGVQMLKMAGFGVQLLKMAGVPLPELCPRSSFPLRPAAVLLINISDGLDFLGGRTPAHWSDQPWEKFIFQEIEEKWICKNSQWDNISARPLPFCLTSFFGWCPKENIGGCFEHQSRGTMLRETEVIPYSYNCVSDPASEREPFKNVLAEFVR